MTGLILTLVLGLFISPAPQETADLQAAVGQLGSFDFATRTAAARTLRRMPPATVVPALEAAARGHVDEYVRFRALVLLSGIDPATMSRVARDLASDRNDRLRTVAYQWFEHHPQPDIVPRLLAALPAETSEFVRPALTRALAANASSEAVRNVLRPLVLRGEDLFRGSVIVALGDYGGVFALEELTTVARLDGPLQDDAVTALARLGRVSSRSVVAGLQKAAARELQPTVSAALCLLQVDCPARVRFVVETLRFAATDDSQLPLLRGAVHAAGILAVAGEAAVFGAMVDTALASNGGARDALTLGIGSVILRRPAVTIAPFEGEASLEARAGLYRDGFDMLSEDFEEERFGAELRRAFWAAPEESAERQLVASLLDALEF